MKIRAVERKLYFTLECSAVVTLNDRFVRLVGDVRDNQHDCINSDESFKGAAMKPDLFVKK